MHSPAGSGNCHENAAVGATVKEAYIATGFALRGPTWLPHSWLVADFHRTAITETTDQEYERYYGVLLEPENARRFRARMGISDTGSDTPPRIPLPERT